MKRLLWLLLLAVPMGAQTITLNDAVQVNANGTRLGLDVDCSYYDQNQECGLFMYSMNPIHYRTVLQAGQYITGGAYAYDYSQYTNYTASTYVGGNYTVYHQGAVSYTGSIAGNSAANTSLTSTLSGSTVATVTGSFPVSLPGSVAGTYEVILYGGGGTGANATITVNGSAQITAATVTAAGSGYASAPTVLVPAYFYDTGAVISPGDTVVEDAWLASGAPVVSTQTDLAYINWAAGVSNGGTAYGESSDLPVGILGQQALVLDATAGGSATSQIVQYGDTGAASGNSGTNMVATWTIAYKAKMASGSGNIALTFGRQAAPSCTSQTQALTASWANYSQTCAVSSDAQNSNAEVIFATTAGLQKIEIADVKITSSANADASGLTARFVTDIGAYLPGTVRVLMANAQAVTVWNATTKQSDILNLDNRGAAPGATGTQDNNIQLIPMQLPQILQLGLAKGFNVVYPLPISMSVAETQCVAAYEWGPNGASDPTGCIALRVGQGFTTPWGQQYSSAGLTISHALGNENWNSGRGSKLNYLSWFNYPSTSTAIPYLPYGWQVQLFASTYKTAASAYTGYVSGVTLLGWGMQTISQGTGNSSYTYPLLFGSSSPSFPAVITSADFGEEAPYTQYYLVNTWSNTLPRSQDTSALAEAIYDTQVSTSPLYANATLNLSKTALQVYESANGYTGAGTTTCPTQAQMDGWANGQGYGIVDAIVFLGAQQLGYSSQHHFTYGQLQQAVSGCPGIENHIWGINTSTANLYYGTFYASQVMNQCIGSGASLVTTSISSNPTFNFTGYNNVAANATAPYMYANLYKNGNNRCLIVVNADPSSSHTLTFSGTNVPSGTVATETYTSANLNDVCTTSSCVTNTTTVPTTLAPHSLTAIKYSVGTTGTTINGNVTITGPVVIH